MDTRTVTFEAVAGLPTPNHCRRVADALDQLTPGRYGDVLRLYADAEDARFDRALRERDLAVPGERVGEWVG